MIQRLSWRRRRLNKMPKRRRQKRKKPRKRRKKRARKKPRKRRRKVLKKKRRRKPRRKRRKRRLQLKRRRKRRPRKRRLQLKKKRKLRQRKRRPQLRKKRKLRMLLSFRCMTHLLDQLLLSATVEMMVHALKLTMLSCIPLEDQVEWQDQVTQMRLLNQQRRIFTQPFYFKLKTQLFNTCLLDLFKLMPVSH